METSHKLIALAPIFETKATNNIFSANHRHRMIREHGSTYAQTVTIEQLLKRINVQK